MKRVVTLVSFAVLAGMVPVGSAAAVPATTGTGKSAEAPDKTATVLVGQPHTWDGTRKVGTNPYYFRQVGPQPDQLGPFSTYTCSSQPYQTCETVLFEFSNPLTQAEIDAGVLRKVAAATIRLDTYDPAQSDFDFVAWASDAQGTKDGFFTGASATSTSGNNPGEAETKTFEIETTPEQPSVWLLLEVVYFAAPNATFKGRATLAG